MASDEFNNPKKIEQFSPNRVFAGIAVTALEPDHKWAYRSGSCYHVVGKAIESGQLEDTDEIVLAGWDDNSHHAFVLRNGQPVVDSMHGVGVYDDEQGLYDGGQGKEPFKVIARMPFAEFKTQFGPHRLDVSEGADYPPP